MYFDIQRIGLTNTSTWGGGNNFVTFMGDVAKWRLTVVANNLINQFYIIFVRDCYGSVSN